jgi:hypothetical protein
VVTLSGDNAAGSDAAADTLRVQASPPSVRATLLGGAGNDTFVIGSATGTLSPILGPVTVDGGTGSNTLQVNASGESTPQVLTITPNQVAGNGTALRVNYLATGGTFGGGISITTGSGDDFLRVLGTLASGTTTINASGGADTFVVGSLGAQLDALGGPLNLDGGSDLNALYVTEAHRTVPVALVVTATTLQSSLAPALISFTATGGT